MSTINERQVKLLQEFCDNTDNELREDYSGRCMYGKRCIGIVTDENPFDLATNLFAFLKDESDMDDPHADELIDIISNTGSRTDSMGLRTIVYFPRIQAEVVEVEENQE